LTDTASALPLIGQSAFSSHIRRENHPSAALSPSTGCELHISSCILVLANYRERFPPVSEPGLRHGQWLLTIASGPAERTCGRDMGFVHPEQPRVARWLQTSWKLSRAHGVANMAVLHRLSDLRSVGTEGSEQVGLAEGLLADSETRVVYAQSPGELARTSDLLG